MKRPIIFLLVFIFSALMFVPSVLIFSCNQKTTAASEDLKITAKSALLLDYASDTVVYEKNANERLPIASMTKLASLSVILDAISKGAVKENDLVTVSENAASVGGSSAFLDAGSAYKVVDLIKTIIIASANDSTVALAEYVAGSEDVFVAKMNKLVANLGLKNTNFANSTGLPAKDHYSSAFDISKIYRTVCNNPIYKKFAKIWMEDFIHPSGRKTGLVNTNRLIKTFDGIEGGKTGYTDAAKFCLTASASRGSTRFIGVIIGANDSKTRFAEMTSLLSYGFSNYESKLVVNAEIPVTIATFEKSKNAVDVFPERNSQIFTEKGTENKYTTDFQINSICAPIAAGTVVGKLFVFDSNNMVVDEVNLIVKKDVEKEKYAEILNRIIHSW